MLKCITNLKLIIINLIFFSVCSHAMPAMEKVVIDNGYMHYSKGSTKPKEAVSLYVLDMPSGKFIKRYLPGCICKIYRRSVNPVYYPLVWTVSQSVSSWIFPNVQLDAMGRTIFYLYWEYTEDSFYSIPKTNFDEQKEWGATVSELPQDDRHEYLYFMSSMESAVNWLSQDKLHLWYALSGEELLLHVPLFSENGTSKSWLVAENPPFFGWARCVPGNVPHEQKSIPFFSVHPNDGIAPLFGVKSKGKEIYLDGEKREADNTLDWIVQFIRQDGTCSWRGLNADNSWKDVDLENGKPPKTVIVNNDSSYIYISSDLTIDPNDIPKSLSSIAQGLREQQLLKDYPPREPSERMKKKLQEAAERTKIQAHIQE